MPLEDNLQHAEAAVQHVKSLGILACNKLGDRLRAAHGIENVIASRQGFDVTAVQGVLSTRNIPAANLQAIAANAIGTGYGNCYEQAIIALVYLHGQGVRPLDLMSFENEDYDHVWVVIGLHDGWQPDNLRSWGAEAVWCDPWQGDGVAFAVGDLVKGKVRNLSWMYKCNTAELVEAGLPDSMFRED